MSQQVKIEDVEVFRLLRAALLKFAQAADQSLSGADSQISRMHSWLESEQMTYWQSQLRKRLEAVTIALEAVRKKKLYKDASGHTPSAIDEEKMLSRCRAAVDQAQEKIQAVRKWLPRLEKESDVYRSGVARLSQSITSDIPNAVALLDRMALSIEQYLTIEAPAAEMAGSAEPSAFEGSISRGGIGGGESTALPGSPLMPAHVEAHPVSSPPAALPDGPAPALPIIGSETPEKEKRDVTHGQ